MHLTLNQDYVGSIPIDSTNFQGRKMRVLFLDVDGVLNSYRSNKFLDDSMIYHLGTIVSRTGVKLVLSSTWRKYPDSQATLEARLLEDCMIIMDKTKVLLPKKLSMPPVERCFEIQEWLDRHEVEDFAILDDNPDANIDGHFFQTDPDVGLTKDIADSVIKYFHNR